MARPFTHPAMDDVSLEAVLYALADPHRLAIVQRLAGCEGTMSCTMAANCELPKSTQSYHFKLLREAGLIRSERKGTSVINALRCDELEARFPGLLATVLKNVEGT